MEVLRGATCSKRDLYFERSLERTNSTKVIGQAAKFPTQIVVSGPVSAEHGYVPAGHLLVVGAGRIASLKGAPPRLPHTLLRA